MKELKKAYEAIETLKSLGIPVSIEQKKAISILERDYIEKKVFPCIKREIEPLMNDVYQRLRLEITYNREEGLSINMANDRRAQYKNTDSETTKSKRQKKYYIRVLFPDNHVICSRNVWETLVDVIKYAGAENVRSLGISLLGDNLVSSVLNPNEHYRAAQKEVEPGLYVSTFSSTDAKYEQIKRINRELNLNLRLEKVLL